MSIFKTNDGVEINYHTYGAENAQPIVLVNGYSASEVTWCCQIEPFVAAGFYVVTYDHRSHGKSQKVHYGMTLARLATDLHELLAHLALHDVVLLGHSMGAATLMAYEELFTDENIASVITEDQAPTFMKHENWLNGVGRDLTDLSKFIDDFPKTRLTQKPLADSVKRELGKGMLPFDFKAYRDLLQNVIIQDWRAELTQETVPHLFIAGGKSPIFLPAHAEAARNLQPHAHSQALIFEGCGHIPHLEDIDKFNQTIIEFVKDNTKKD